ncbi:MAG: benzoylformate decarboxylase [Pseudomonadota bacterium]|jgi:benzoylformate decarboxylase|nr:benzoylformate decarboxylase [Rubrivivax sp.]MCA3256879.1 benzoylformate decarboxylase [Rubrivivax sp.]MCZ8029691.1 benzoylformate decarboxylase [Rubrivivax sp.]
MSATATVREAVWALMRAHGMTTVFGNPGSTELGFFLGWPADFRYRLGLQECVVVGMADGFAQATGNAAFVNLHSAAGVGHAMGAIFTAFKNRTPLVLTAGQQARSILPFDPFLHSAEATTLPRPYVKWAVEPGRAEDVPLAIARAYHVAMTPPRGPVLVSVPADDWARPCEPVAPRRVGQSVRPDAATLAAIGDALDAASRPAFVIGPAVDRDGAWALARELAERHRARVWGAPMSGRAGFPEDHPLFAGWLPSQRERIVELLAGHDLVFALGANAFTYHVQGEGPHAPAGAAVVQVTDDPQAAAWAPLGTSVFASLRPALADLLARPVPPRVAGRAAPPQREPAPQVPVPAAGERIPVPYLMQALTAVRPRDSIVFEEAPSSRGAMQRHLTIWEPGTYWTMDSGGLGHGLAAAMGVALAELERPPAARRRVIALIGDGSAMYSIQALWNAAQWGLPVTVLIVRNRRYGALQHFAPHFGFAPGADLVGTDLPGLDFVALAAGHGLPARRVADGARLAEALREAIRADGPVLLEVETV